MPPQIPQKPQSALFQTMKLAQASPAQKPAIAEAPQSAEISSRLKLVEQRIENLRSHIELLDNSLIEKHKALVSEIRDIQDDMRSLRADIDATKELAERIAKRTEDFASREEVKVLQRYVEMWQPLQFVTRSEVATLVQNALKEQKSK